MRYERQSTASTAPGRSVSPPATTMTTTSPSQDSILLSGVYDSRVFLIRCPASARGHDLRELVKTQLGIEYPPLQLKVIDLKQEDGSYAREEDAVAARRVQFRVELSHSEHADATVVEPASPTTCNSSPVRLGPAEKHAHSDVNYEHDVKDNKRWGSSWITQKYVDSLKRITGKLQRLTKDEELGKRHPAESGISQDAVRYHSKQQEPKVLKSIVQQVSNHPMAWPFRRPVDTSRVDDYLVFIKDSVDLSLISKRVCHGIYSSVGELKADLVNICVNCKTYNPQGTQFHTAGVELLEFTKELI